MENVKMQGNQSREFEMIPPKIKLSYTDDIKLTSTTPLYHLFEGKSLYHPNTIHTIRVLNSNSQFVEDDFDSAASLFIKELLRLVSIQPNCVIVDSFEIFKGKIAFATLPYASLSCQEIKSLKQTFNGIDNVSDMIANVLSDVEFLRKELRIENCSNILTLQSIFKFEESDTYFLGHWLNTILSEEVSECTMTIGDATTSSVLYREIMSLVLRIIELNGLDQGRMKKLRKMESKNHVWFETVIVGLLFGDDLPHMSEELKELLKTMVHKENKLRPTFDEFKMRLNRSKQAALMDTKNEIETSEKKEPTPFSKKSDSVDGEVKKEAVQVEDSRLSNNDIICRYDQYLQYD